MASHAGILASNPHLTNVQAGMLEKEEYVEQAFFFRTLRERLAEDLPLQALLNSLKEEILATSNLPLAIDFLRSDLMLRGVLAPAMERLAHYFTPFQAYVIREAEDDRSRFDFRVGLEILQREAEYKTGEPTPAGLFLYQFEALCRNRLKYDPGLKAVSDDPMYPPPWREWILIVRRQIGIVDFADMVYVRSQLYQRDRQTRQLEAEIGGEDVLFGEREGRIAWAHRQKEPLLMLAAFQRQLGYPAVPRVLRPAEDADLLPQLTRRMERLEQRMKLLEEENRAGIDLSRYYAKQSQPPTVGEEP